MCGGLDQPHHLDPARSMPSFLTSNLLRKHKWTHELNVSAEPDVGLHYP